MAARPAPGFPFFARPKKGNRKKSAPAGNQSSIFGWLRTRTPQLPVGVLTPRRALVPEAFPSKRSLKLKGLHGKPASQAGRLTHAHAARHGPSLWNGERVGRRGCWRGERDPRVGRGRERFKGGFTPHPRFAPPSPTRGEGFKK